MKKRKKKEIFFLSFRELFHLFWSLVCRKRWLGSVLGVRRRSREQKKSNFKKKVLSTFLAIMSRKNGVCVGRCMCLRNHGAKKVIRRK